MPVWKGTLPARSSSANQRFLGRAKEQSKLPDAFASFTWASCVRPTLSSMSKSPEHGISTRARQERSRAFQTEPSGPPEFQPRTPGACAAVVLVVAEQLAERLPDEVSTFAQSKETILAVAAGSATAGAAGGSGMALALGHGALDAGARFAILSSPQGGHSRATGALAAHAAVRIRLAARNDVRGEGDMGDVETVAKDKLKIAAFPANYFDHAGLSLAFKSAKDFSIDEVGAKAKKVKANAPGNYVTALQTDLATIGYLEKKQATGLFDAATKRAVLRFQRHAARVSRMPDKADVDESATFTGTADGVCNQATAKEIRVWIAKKFVIPVGRFKTRKIDVPGTNNLLREDAADEWEAIVSLVNAAGGTLDGPYGDTLRGLNRKSSPGASGYSFHYSGRAIDINQGLAGGAKVRYFLQQEPVGNRTFWRIFCKTEKQDGTQGKEFTKGQIKCFLPFNEKEFDIPKGHYFDLTALIESRGTFQRIAAQKGFDDASAPKLVRQKKLEWWHFQYTVDKQSTFLDEVELIGFTEKEVKSRGWTTEADLENPPG